MHILPSASPGAESNNDSISLMLLELYWPALQLQRKYAHAINTSVYKILNNYFVISPSYLLLPLITSDKPSQLQILYYQTSIDTFFPRTDQIRTISLNQLLIH